MAKSVNHKKTNLDFVDLLGKSKSDFEKVEFEDTINTLEQLAGIYIAKLVDEIDTKDLASSGYMQKNIKPSEVEVNGTKYSIAITAPFYINFVDEGVNGWKQTRNSRYSFKTKGVNPDGEMVKSLKKYLAREMKTAPKGKAISTRERKAKKIIDAKTKSAMTAAYMIKRQGIKKRPFLNKVQLDMKQVIKNELSQSLRIDIINNLS